jgi:ATP-dependent DNA helicase DinG
MAAFQAKGRLAAEAPTGSGKTLAVVTPAMLLAAKGQRTVISTETLGLQAQIADKDGPAAAQAVEEATGYRPVLAPLKGWSNYSCTLAAQAAAHKETGALKRLADWALAEAATDGTGDRADCPIDVDDEIWAKVSVSPTACPGQDRCPFGETCRPAAARQRAAEADVIVVNHSILAMQVVTAAPVVIGGEQLGAIDHLVIDEAHSFAAKVRSHGTARISAYLVLAAARSLEHCLGRGHRAAAQGFELAKALDAQLSDATKRFGADKALGKSDDVFDGLGVAIENWVARERRALQSARGGLLAMAAARSRLDELTDSLKRASRDDMARWLELGEPHELSANVKLSGTRLVVAPVETGGTIAANLFGSKDSPTRPSVIALSATLPSSALPELGIGVKRTVYPSPFETAYRESLLYVPKLDASSPLPVDRRGRIDVKAHQDWAEPLIIRLVAANGGSALVLAATTAAGRRYAKALQAAAQGRWHVHSQWDGPVARVVGAWRSDIGSVLVGTRSLMTGVDAPGVTCTLVVVDRVPRAAPNPVDDARRDALAARLSLDRWGADRFVYVADAALLLSQAAGRLVRSSSDRGLVAVLDPRLLKGPSAYPEPTRRALLDALGRFVTKTTQLNAALTFARANAARRSQQAPEAPAC